MKRKFLLHLTTCAIVLSSLPVFTSHAYTPYSTDKERVVQTSTFSLTNGAGEPVANITGLDTVTVSVRVKRGTEAAEKQPVALFVTAKQNKTLLEIATTATLLTANQAAELSSDITLPPETERLEAYLWDGYRGMRVLRQAVKFDEEAFTVTGITLDGKPIQEFDPTAGSFAPEQTEYTVHLDASWMNYPEILVQTDNITATTEVICKDKFPVTAQGDTEAKNADVIVRVSKGQVTKEYTIHFVQEAPAITGMQYRIWNDVTNPNAGTQWVSGNETTQMSQEIIRDNAPQWLVELAPETELMDVALTKSGDINITQKTDVPNIFADRTTQKLVYFSPEFIGGSMLQQVLEDCNNGKAVAYSADNPAELNESSLRFTINRSARIYLWGNVSSAPVRALYTELGFTPCAGASGFSSAGIMGWKVIQRSSDTPGSSYEYTITPQKNWYQQDVIIPDGGQPVMVEIPASATGGYHWIVVKFLDGNIVQNAEYMTTGNADKQGSSTVILYEPELKDEEEATVTDNILFEPGMVNNRDGYTPADLSEEIQGAEAIVLPWQMTVPQTE